MDRDVGSSGAAFAGGGEERTAFGDGRHYLVLGDRGAVSVRGPEARDFLQNLVTNDIRKATAERAIYAALLTPQGKFLFDFFVIACPEEEGERLLLDCEGSRADELVRRLTMYKLRTQVTIEAMSDRHDVAALSEAPVDLGDGPGAAAPFANGRVFRDPRDGRLGIRALLPCGTAESALRGAGFSPVARTAYDYLRISLCIPDGTRDIPAERALPLEYNIEALSGIDFEKGCYVGQEVTARMKYRGRLRRQLFAVVSDGVRPESGTPVMFDGRKAGTLLSGAGDRALASIRCELAEKARASGGEITADGSSLRLLTPADGRASDAR